VNPANREPEHAHGLEAAEPTTVVDCTLREGEQTPGVIFPRRDKLRLAELLVAAGAREIECGMPAISEYEAETVREIVQLGLGCRTTVLVMATRDDVLRARDCGVDGIGLSLPAGRLQLEKKLRWSEDRVIETAVELSALANAEGLRVNLSPYDTTRADPDFLERYITTVYKEGHIDGVRVVDTVGAAGPGLIAGLVRKLIDWTGGSVDVEVHCHDDFGLAVANTLAGIGAGARVASTTLNGLGERAGNAPTQQVVAALELLYGIDTGFDLPALTALGRDVERMARRSLPDDEPLIGSMTFALEAGSIVSGYMADPLVAFPFPPETVGASARVLLGKQSGKHSLDYKAAELGLGTLDDCERNRLLERVKTEAQETGQTISDERFKQWLEEARVETTR
jgi:isopropylmalate/homocitrate/citramalate synthase